MKLLTYVPAIVGGDELGEADFVVLLLGTDMHSGLNSFV